MFATPLVIKQTSVRTLAVRFAASTVLGAVLVAGAVTPAAAHGTTNTGTYANCFTLSNSALYGQKTRQITGYFPAGSTSGVTYLKARVQYRVASGGYWYTCNNTWLTFAISGQESMVTGAARFPYGHFRHIGQTAWYSAVDAAFTQNWMDGYTEARVVYQLTWPDGGLTTSTTQWAACW